MIDKLKADLANIDALRTNGSSPTVSPPETAAIATSPNVVSLAAKRARRKALSERAL
jgi:hypothetical protein